MSSTTLLVDLLNGRPPTDRLSAQTDGENLLDIARREGVTLLLAELPGIKANGTNILGENADEFLKARQHAIAMELVRNEEIPRILEKLSPFEPILLKGVALAQLYYPQSHLRPMVDTDLIVPPDSLDRARDILDKEGFRPLLSVSGDLVMNQYIARKPLRARLNLDIDVHTRLFNRHALNSILPHAQIAESAVPVAAMGEFARAPCPAHVLVHACLHMLAHHAAERKLIWLYDIHLVVDRFDTEDASRFLAIARTARLAQVFAIILGESHSCFPFENRQLLEETRVLAHQQQSNPHPATAFLDAPGRLDRLRHDWQNLDGLSARSRWLRQNLFPDAQYMVKRYKLSGKWMVPAAYLWRIVRGSVRLFRTRG